MTIRYRNCQKVHASDPDYFECARDDVVMEYGSVVVIRHSQGGRFYNDATYHLVIEGLCVESFEGFNKHRVTCRIEDILSRHPRTKRIEKILRVLQEHSTNKPYWGFD